MNPERHNAQVVAQLIHTSAPELFRLLLGRNAISTLEQLVNLSQNRFSYRYVRVAEINAQVRGIATVVPAIELTHELNSDYQQILNPWAQLRWNLAHRLILDRVLEHTYPPNSVYIGNLAVQAADRGQGIGTELLRYCLDEAATIHAQQVFISVDVHNPRAQKLYESFGFQVVQTKTIELLGSAIGSRVLSLSLS
jgi:ribosomal protein S18 acetylase RimI-like enzyme